MKTYEHLMRGLFTLAVLLCTTLPAAQSQVACENPIGESVYHNSQSGATGLGVPGGVMFDVSSTEDIVINRLNIGNFNNTVTLYRKTTPGSHLGSEEAPGDWEVIWNGFVEWSQEAYDTDAHYGTIAGLSIPIEAGETAAFYFTSSGNMNIVNNASLDQTDVVSTDGTLSVYCGTGFYQDFNTSGYGDYARPLSIAFFYKQAIEGCTDEAACNYSPEVTCDDNSCEYPADGFDCQGNCLYDPINETLLLNSTWVFGLIDCETGETLDFDTSEYYTFDEDGLMSVYDGETGELGFQIPYTVDDCTLSFFVGKGEDEVLFGLGNVLLIDDDGDFCIGLVQASLDCTDESACNYNPDAMLSDNALCTYPAEDYLDCEGNCLQQAVDTDALTSTLWLYSQVNCETQEIIESTMLWTFDDQGLVYLHFENEEPINIGGYATDGCTIDLLDAVGENNVIYQNGNLFWDNTDNSGNCYLWTPVPEGCTDETACNFDPEADVDDGSCTYPTEDYIDCEGDCLNDADNDGVCDEVEIIGCMQEAACNFNPEATDNDWSLCEYPEPGFDCEGNCLYPGLDIDHLTSQIWYEGPADCETGQLFETFENYIVFSTNGTVTTFDGESDEELWSATWTTNNCVVIIDDFFFMWIIGENFVGEGKGCWGFAPAPQGCTDETACNFDPEADFDDDSCTYPTEDYLDCEGNCINDADQDGVCDELEVPGCTDESACNFVAEATDDNGTCFYAEPGFDCEGNCLSAGIDNATIVNTFWEIGVADCETGEFIMENGNVVIDFLPSGYYEVIYINEGESEFGEWSTNGCTITFDGYFVMTGDSNAFFGSDIECIAMIPLASGCTDPIACNFDPEAEYDDDSCYYTVDTYYDCDGVCLNDADEDGVCDELEIQGCTDVTACNFVAEATDDDNSCEYADDFFDCEGNCLNDADGDGVCDELEVEGCTDVNACNYDPEASEDDGSCFAPVEGNIAGSVQVLAFATESYTYPSTGEYEVIWTVDNGTILSGQGTAVIEVIWDEGFSGYVRAYELLGDCEGPEAELRVTIFGTVHVDEMSDASLSVYPNPSNGWVTVDAGNLTEPAHLEVLDASGRLVHQQTVTGTAVLQLAHLADGNYIVKLNTSNTIITEHLLIRK